MYVRHPSMVSAISTFEPINSNVNKIDEEKRIYFSHIFINIHLESEYAKRERENALARPRIE